METAPRTGRREADKGRLAAGGRQPGAGGRRWRAVGGAWRFLGEVRLCRRPPRYFVARSRSPRAAKCTEFAHACAHPTSANRVRPCPWHPKEDEGKADDSDDSDEEDSEDERKKKAKAKAKEKEKEKDKKARVGDARMSRRHRVSPASFTAGAGAQRSIGTAPRGTMVSLAVVSRPRTRGRRLVVGWK